MLTGARLKPWRIHYWLTPKEPRSAEFVQRTKEICELYTRPLAPDEIVLCVDEKTSIQPRPRDTKTKPAAPENRPVQVEHSYRRDGALNLFAAFDTRSGKVFGQTYARKRQIEFIKFLLYLEQQIPAAITVIHLVLDNVPTHHGKVVKAWLAAHPRFKLHFLPVHCSWMNQVEQWFSILTRKRLKVSDFNDKALLAKRLEGFIKQWNETAEPFKWTAKSFEKVLAKVCAI